MIECVEFIYPFQIEMIIKSFYITLKEENMSRTVNKVILIGHLGDGVKMHYFEGGGCIGRFPIATNESYTNKQTGERITSTEWHTIVVRNKAAETCEKYLGKGDLIYVEGRIRTRQWQDDSGNARYSTEILATDFTFLSGRREGMEARPHKEEKTDHESIPAKAAATPNMKEGEEDLPF